MIRPGDTLESITETYLGDRQRWAENWRLNPEIENPHRIYPGQRLRVLLPPSLPEYSAQVVRRSKRVEDQLRPHSWSDAETLDMLLWRDGIRTFEWASAVLRLGDDAELIITEQSLIFVGEEADVLEEVDRRLIEVVEGQADLEASAEPWPDGGIEIVLGGASATPRPGDSDRVQARARRPVAGGAQVMVYSGVSDLESGGTQVTLVEGTGSSVVEGAPPSPPEPLLPSPETIEPAPGEQIFVANPPFVWESVTGANSYAVEVCSDPNCGQLVERVVAFAAPPWLPSGLPGGDFFWRVNAVSATGLDGFPSDPVPFSIVGTENDTQAPVAAMQLSGPQYQAGGRLWLGGGGQLLASVSDAEAGLAETTLLLDDEPVELEQWASSWAAGRHGASILAVDRAGNQTRLDPLTFHYDPDPPILAWGFEGGPELGRLSGSETPRSPAATSERPVPGLEWRSFESDSWVKMRFRRFVHRSDMPYFSQSWEGRENRFRFNQDSPKTRYRERIIRFRQPHIVVRPEKGRILLAGELEASAERGVWIHATDPGSGVDTMSFQVVQAFSSAPGNSAPGNSAAGGGDRQSRFLEIKAQDHLGAETVLRWPITLVPKGHS